MNHRALVDGLQALGLELVVENDIRLPTLTTVRVPEGVDDIAVRKNLLANFNIEIGGGLGDFKGKAWRIGLMGHTSKIENVVLFLAALGAVLNGQGYGTDTGSAIETAVG